jgi:hypothetical protein
MADLKNSQGKLTFLRAHDVGTGWGPPSDQLDVEVVFMLDSVPQGAFAGRGRDQRAPPLRILVVAAEEAVIRALREAFDYKSGERQIPRSIATSIRRLADLGSVGSLVRSSIRRVAPDLPPARSHRIAVQVLADLTGAGLVR